INQLKEEYGIELIEDIQKYKPYDAIVVAVKHKLFIEELDFKVFKNLMKNQGKPVLIDIKGVYNKDKAQKEDFIYWRL
ncbi:MAG: nucleotide sugar dehydrogenase, partial [Aquificae bacterium]|nr:nucleotide sugar dehydrogenase [Aquificota bacterium]